MARLGSIFVFSVRIYHLLHIVSMQDMSFVIISRAVIILQIKVCELVAFAMDNGGLENGDDTSSPGESDVLAFSLYKH